MVLGKYYNWQFRFLLLFKQTASRYAACTKCELQYLRICMDKNNLEILSWQLRFNINLIEILNTLFEVEPLVIGPGGLTFDLVLHFIYILNFLCHSYQAMLSTGILKTFLKA